MFALDVWVWGMWWVFGRVSGVDGVLGWFALFRCVDELVVCVGLGGYFRYEFAAGVWVCWWFVFWCWWCVGVVVCGLAYGLVGFRR